MLKRSLWAIAFFTSFISGLCSAADDPTVNRLIAAQCAQCHGPNGKAVGDIDGLDDESFRDLMNALLDMRSEDEPEDIMDHQALGYTRGQLRRIAKYYDSIKDQDEDMEGSEKQHED